MTSVVIEPGRPGFLFPGDRCTWPLNRLNVHVLEEHFLWRALDRSQAAYGQQLGYVAMKLAN